MYRKPLIFAATCWLAAAAASAEVQVIDWYIGSQPSINMQLEPGEYRLVAHGGVFGASYKRVVALGTIPIPGLPAVSSVPGPGLEAKEEEEEKSEMQPPPPLDKKVPDPCDPYYIALKPLAKAASVAYLNPDLSTRGAEEKFSFALLALKAAMDAPPGSCKPDLATVRTFNSLTRASTLEIGTFNVKRGKILKAQISRALGEDAEGLKFTYELTTGKLGSWQASYGFGVTPNKDRHYYSREGDTDDTFVITQENDNGGVHPNAAVFYTWLPAKWENSFCNFGVAGGIGVDKNNLVLLFGGHMTFSQNIGLLAGIALHQEARLRGEYEVGQTISENLTPDALEEKVNKTTWFLGITYRFGESEK